ncbi:MAG: tRNA 2-selenouridine(34) synthase MnmH [Firmicutes bacterium]|nr:tRNA 2-selenouridine(34) synthase MnmH [Bacillota bacterium]
MRSLLGVEQWLLKKEQYFLVDVRSPGEFRAASIPGAVNIPLFTDEERAAVGTVYCQEGADLAKKVGLTFVAPKLPWLVETILSSASNREIVLYCWRGGMRSNSVADVLETLGYPAWRLAGGYKAFRRLVVRYLANYSFRVPVFVLNGLTGVGKTMIIRELIRLGVPALDLEAMAGHRGSVFGGVGLGAPHSQKDFEALLFLELRRYQGSSYLVVEGEGKRIGPIVLPDFLFAAMKQGPHILLETILDVRVARILAEYQATSTEQAEELAAAVLSLRGRLGDEKCADLAEKICSGRYAEAAIALCRDYYDCFYKDSRRATGQYLSVVDVDDLDQGVQRIMMILAKYRHSS